MSFAQVLDELSSLTVGQRQTLIRRALEIDDAPLSKSDEEVVGARLADHHEDPTSSLSLSELAARIRRRRS